MFSPSTFGNYVSRYLCDEILSCSQVKLGFRNSVGDTKVGAP